MPDSDFLAALRALHEGGVEFAVVGGLAAVLNGAPVSTFDLDIVPARDEANVARLLRVLDTLDGIYRMQPDRRLKPDASHLSSPGHHNLITNCGRLMCWERSAADFAMKICCRTPSKWKQVGECECAYWIWQIGRASCRERV